MKYERIIIVADDSPSSIKAIRYGYELARQLKPKVKIGLIGVLEPSMTEGNVDAGVFPEQAGHNAKKKRSDSCTNCQTITVMESKQSILPRKEKYMTWCYNWQGSGRRT